MFKKVVALILGLIVGGAVIMVINPSKGEVPRRPLVTPGNYDQYYGFLSGGPGGDIRVIGVPSMRLIRRIPVFEPSMRYNYGVDKDGNPAGDLKEYNNGDTHHPLLSQTNNKFDGRWLFIHDKANGRVARIDLSTFAVDKLLKVPNNPGVHGIALDPVNSRWLAASSEFIIPIPQKATTDPKEHKSVETIIDPATMEVKYQILSYQQDNMDYSKDGKILFGTAYNTENALTEAGSIQKDEDAVIATNMEIAEKAYADGKYTVIDGVPILDPEKIPGLMTLIPVPKNPHGVSVTPDGKYAIASGKLSPTVTIIDVKTLKVLAQPTVGFGPLHTVYDGKGNAYTTNFIDSTVVKWSIEKAIKGDKDFIIDTQPVAYNPGHVTASGTQTGNPQGDWLISLNKLSKTRFLEVGPDLPENNQLFDISGDKMKLVYDMPSDPEPHDGVIVPADIINKSAKKN